MSDEIEYGPDPNELRRHQKKMLTEREYRAKYRRIDFYRPHPKQLEFHNLTQTECALRAGNQLGKTHAGAAQMTFDALSLYPDWYKGRRFIKPPPIERPVEFLGWCGSTTSILTRDGQQLKLFGDISQADGLGSGMIPLDCIVGRPTMSRGIANFFDTVALRRDTGGSAAIQFKTYEMKRTAWQSSPVDVVWLDEQDEHDEIYGECLARLTATKGRIYSTLTPMLGSNRGVRKRFRENPNGDMAEVIMGLEDAKHIPESEHAAIASRYKLSERATRLYGADLQGEGAVFEIPEDMIQHNRDPATFPHFWPWLWGLDFGRGMSAQAHPFAAVLAAWDRDNDVIYIVEAFRMKQALLVQHVERIKSHPCWDAPIAWPHDGTANDLGSGQTIAMLYKKAGLKMLPKWSTFPESMGGGYGFEAGVAAMEHRFANGKLLVASHLSEFFDEYRNYHRKDGLVVKIDDDILSATRQVVMSISKAKPLDSGRNDPQYIRPTSAYNQTILDRPAPWGWIGS